MYGSLAVSDGGVFTKRWDFAEDSSDTGDDNSAAALWHFAQGAAHIRGVVTSASDTGEYYTSGVDQPPSWVEAYRSVVDNLLAREEHQKRSHRVLMLRLLLRLAELKREGTSEGLPWSTASEVDFWMLLNAHARVKAPLVFLMDNGNLRAAWRNDAGEQVAIEFLGYNDVQFVFFAKRPEGPSMARSVGQDKLGRIAVKIAGDGLTELFLA